MKKNIGKIVATASITGLFLGFCMAVSRRIKQARERRYTKELIKANSENLRWD